VKRKYRNSQYHHRNFDQGETCKDFYDVLKSFMEFNKVLVVPFEVMQRIFNLEIRGTEKEIKIVSIRPDRDPTSLWGCGHLTISGLDLLDERKACEGCDGKREKHHPEKKSS
jgi:hypothetical protein